MQRRITYADLKFYEQPIGTGACGKYSIQNALVFLRIKVTQDVLNLLTEASPAWTARFGISSQKIKMALKSLKMTPSSFTIYNKDDAKKQIDKSLTKSPIILLTQRGEHWITVGRKSGQYYMVVNADKKPLLQKKTWNQLVAEVEDDKYFHFIQVKVN